MKTTFSVRWSDLDSNGHMANTAYLDVCVDVRLGYFASRGIGPRELRSLEIGPVVQRDEVEYHRELFLGDPFTVDLELAGISDDGSRFRVRNHFRKEDGTLVTEVTSTGGWLDQRVRRLVAPPDSLHQALRSLPRSDDFEVLRSSVKR